MIGAYKDHAANERTFLAWIRTGVTVMTLGFFIEKFQLFLESLRVMNASGRSVADETASEIRVLSVLLVGLGLAVVVLSTVRYVQTKRAIDRQTAIEFRGLMLPIALSGLLVIAGAILLLSLTRLV